VHSPSLEAPAAAAEQREQAGHDPGGGDPLRGRQLGRIGLLNPELSFKLSSLYGHFKSFSTQAQDQVPEMDPALAVRVMRSVEDSLKSLAAEAEALKGDLGAMAGKLG